MNVVFEAEVGEKVGEPDSESEEVRCFDVTQLPAPEQFAFDHFEDIQLFRVYLAKR